MNSDSKRQAVMAHEGQILAAAGHHGEEYAAAMARCVIDGAMNALIRMEGHEIAAKYAFALSDRVAGGIKAPTALFDLSMPQPVSSASPPKRRRLAWLTWWTIGFVAGVFVGMSK